jgi:hypothetical protein
LNDGERDFEQAMTRLTPTVPGFDEVQIWMTALARRQQRQLAFWRIAAGGLAACLVAALWPAPAPPKFLPVRVVRSPPAESNPNRDLTAMPVAAAAAPSFDWRAGDDNDSYFRMRQRVMLGGLSALNVEPRQTEAVARAPAPLPRVDPVVTPSFEGPIGRFFSVLQKGAKL